MMTLDDVPKGSVVESCSACDDGAFGLFVFRLLVANSSPSSESTSWLMLEPRFKLLLLFDFIEQTTLKRLRVDDN